MNTINESDIFAHKIGITVIKLAAVSTLKPMLRASLPIEDTDNGLEVFSST